MCPAFSAVSGEKWLQRGWLYYEELTLKEISAIMKVSESRISQLHTKAILRMRGRLERQRSLMG